MLTQTALSAGARQIAPGATAADGGCYFAVWAPWTEELRVHLYTPEERKTAVYALPERRGGMWSGFVPGASPGDLYALEACGSERPEEGIYNQDGRLLIDPYVRVLNRPVLYDYQTYLTDPEAFVPKAVIQPEHDSFDWQGVGRPEGLDSELILYETHVRGISRLCAQVPAEIRGTYLGLCSPFILDHLERLGITAVQLMPVTCSMSEPDLGGRGMSNYWGYNPLCMMLPEPRYACDPLKVRDEFRTMVRELHRRGIGVILDVVYNHTAEGGKGGPVISFRGLDNRGYYAFADGKNGPDYSAYYNVSGCGNSFNCGSLPGHRLVLDTLRYWYGEMGVDGFRFDLGVTLGREFHGASRYEFERDSAFLQECFSDPCLRGAIMIAEPWDIGHDGYRLGQFPLGWREQNDHFRDNVRRFWRGDDAQMGEFATRMLGSRDIFAKNWRDVKSSVNYITYHDGFTLEDLVSYSSKHNEDNGYHNEDGAAENFSTNCGVEGPSADPVVIRTRARLKRNYLASVLLAQGTPHLLGGDELSRTQKGNNNAYCQDNELSYYHWPEHPDPDTAALADFVGRLTRLRRGSLVLRGLYLADDAFTLLRDAVFHAEWYRTNGTRMEEGHWRNERLRAVMLHEGGRSPDFREEWCVLVNNSEHDIYFTLPELDDTHYWEAVLDTGESDGLPRRFSNERGLECVCACYTLKLLRMAEVSGFAASSEDLHDGPHETDEAAGLVPEMPKPGALGAEAALQPASPDAQPLQTPAADGAKTADGEF